MLFIGRLSWQGAELWG